MAGLVLLLGVLGGCDNSAADALRTCEGGNTEACFRDGMAAANAAQPRFGDARKAFSAACRPSTGSAPSSVNRNLPKACNELAILVRDAKGGPKDIPRAIELFEIACKDGIDRACVDLGALLWTEDPQGKPESDRAVVLFEGACAKVEPRDPSPKDDVVPEPKPGRAGDAPEGREGKAPGPDGEAREGKAPDEPGKAEGKAEKADGKAEKADGKADGSEGKLGKGEGKERPEERGAGPLAEACDRLGRAWEKGIGVEPPMKDLEKAGQDYERACRARFAPGCVSAGVLAASTKKKEDIALAAAYYERACKLDPRQGCFELAVLHDTKAWWGSSDERAVEFYKRSCAIDPTRGCFEAAALMEEGRVKAGEGEIASLYNQACEHGNADACARRALKR